MRRFLKTSGWPAGLLLGALALAPMSARAQELFGTLRRVDGGPAAGVVLVALRASDGGMVGRTVTGEQGTYRLRVSTDSLELRALRIGHQPQTLGAFRLGPDEQREMSTLLSDAPVTISAVQTRTDSRCRVRPEGASTVARLFADARTALLASQLVSLDGRPRSRYRLIDEQWSARDDRVMAVRATEFLTDSLRPFQSVPVDSLLADGYVVHLFDGSTVYRAPDAEVLADDRFLANYCLHLVEGTGEQAGSIGVGFRPARTRRGITEVQGTLWLDRTTNALQRLEYGYVGLEPLVARTNPGGWVAFTKLPGGVWFVSHWTIRMPQVGRRVVATTRDLSDRRTVTGIQVVSGEVLEVGVNGWVRYTVGATDAVDESGAVIDRPLEAHGDPGFCRRTPGTLVYGTILGAQGAPLASAAVTVAVRNGREAGAAGLSARTDSAGRYRLCDVAADRLTTVRVTADGHAPDSVALRTTSLRAGARVDLMLRRSGPVTLADLARRVPEPGLADGLDALDRDPVAAATRPSAGARTAPSSTAPRSLLRVVDRANAPVPFATITLREGRGHATDVNGQLTLDDTTSLSLPIQVQRIGYRPYEGTVTRVTSREPFVVTLEVLPRVLDTVETVAGRTGGAVVRILDQDSVPIPYAMLTLSNRAPRAADSTGRVLLGPDDRLSLPVRVQRIGYQPHAGTVTRASPAEPFIITLAPLVRDLQAVRTIAPRHTLLSRTGFYDRMSRVRRGAIVGEFIPPEELELRATGPSIANALYGRQYVSVVRGALYGRAGCRMQILLDGKLMDSNAPDAFTHSGAVMAIEIYPSTANAPAELIPLTDRGSCGIVALWTGPRM